MTYLDTLRQAGERATPDAAWICLARDVWEQLVDVAEAATSLRNGILHLPEDQRIGTPWLNDALDALCEAVEAQAPS